jgi:preprotein translocase subunit SecE
MKTQTILEFIKKAKQYLYEVKTELRKIVWPERDKATKTTYVVVIFIILVTIFLGLIDISFSKIISYLI